jgi:hypothetical protein
MEKRDHTTTEMILMGWLIGQSSASFQNHHQRAAQSVRLQSCSSPYLKSVWQSPEADIATSARVGELLHVTEVIHTDASLGNFFLQAVASRDSR